MYRFFVFAFAAIFFLFSCGTRVPQEIIFPPEPEESLQIETVPEKIEPSKDILTLIAAGDNLFHEPMLQSSLGKEGYNFSPMYAGIKPIIEAADIAFVNQETVFGGERFGYSGYPRFNTPAVLAQTLADTGFDIANHANNHAMDMGEAGIIATMDTWEKIPGVTYLGIRRQAETQPAIITKNNIRLGFLAYTYGTNGIALPADKPWLVSLIKRETMAAEIDALRPLCDILIVSMHWGDEYEPEPNARQRELAAFLAEHDVDIVIGHHPHVLQRFEFFDRPEGKKTLVFFSLGNFISNQRRHDTLAGAIMYVKLIKEGDAVSVDKSGLIPVVTHYEAGFTNTQVIPLYAYTQELMDKHLQRLLDKRLTLEYFYSLVSRLQTRLFMYNPLTAGE